MTHDVKAHCHIIHQNPSGVENVQVTVCSTKLPLIELHLKPQQEGSPKANPYDPNYKHTVKQAVPSGMKLLGTKRGRGEEGGGGGNRQKTGANINTGDGDDEFILVGSPTYFYLRSNSRIKYKYCNGRRR
jgi:hypothetical protein